MSGAERSAVYVEADKELTMQVVNKGLLTFSREDHDYPDKLAARLGILNAGFCDAVSGYGGYLKN